MLSILINKLRKVPTLKCVSCNTDAVQFEIDEDKVPLAEEVLNDWQKRYRLELERDDVIKLVMRDINNYIELLETKKGKEVNFKGGCFASCPKIIIDENNKIITKYEPKFKANSLAIVSEALAKYLLFDIPIEHTINKDNDIRKYQIISHLGSTYEKCVQETDNGYIDLENRNNRIYAGKKPTGLIYKKKANGRLDKLANCPTNPIVDNANECCIEDINKEWYIKLATQWANDFKGVKRLTEYKKTELVEMAQKMGIEFDPKIKKDELIKLIEENKGKSDNVEKSKLNIYQKINEMKKEIMTIDFIMDQVMPTNLGGREYPSIGQYYRTINELSQKYGMMFKWDVVSVESFEKELFKPINKVPQHVWTIYCKATFYDLDAFATHEDVDATPKVQYSVIASGSDICDKGVSGASALAFRNWFDKNFSPKYLTVDEFASGETVAAETTEQTAEPKVPTYIPPEKKEELTEEVVAEVQQTESDKDDVKEIIGKIMKVREITTNPDWGASTLQQLISGELSSADILEIGLKVDNKLDSLKENK